MSVMCVVRRELALAALDDLACATEHGVWCVGAPEPRMPVNGIPVNGSLACTAFSRTWDCADLFSAYVGQP